MSIYLAYLVLGAVGGVLAGMMGVGGGIIIVPALFFIFQAQGFPEPVLMHLAVGSSLTTVVFTAFSSTRSHHLRSAVLWPAFKDLVPGIILGALLGASIATHLPTDFLRVLFGLFELFVAIQIGFGLKPSPGRDLLARSGMLAAGAVIGCLSVVLGIAGGSLTVPFLLWCNVSMKNAVGTSSAVGLPLSLAGAAGFLVVGWNDPFLPYGSTGYLYWPAILGIIVTSMLFAPAGAWLAHNLPVKTLKRCFAAVLAIIALRMIY